MARRNLKPHDELKIILETRELLRRKHKVKDIHSLGDQTFKKMLRTMKKNYPDFDMDNKTSKINTDIIREGINRSVERWWKKEQARERKLKRRLRGLKRKKISFI